MTTVTFVRIGEVLIQTNGKTLVVPTVTLSFDQDLREIVAQAIANPGVAVPVPNTARVPRPRNSYVYGVKL